MDKITIAVIGAGSWGRNLIRNFATMEGVELACVCDVSPQARGWVAKAYPSVQCVADAASIWDSKDIRAAVVSTEAPQHAELALQALRAGKDVFVEKPLALREDDCVALCHAAEQGGRMLMVGHLLLYHPAVEHLKKLVDTGELGDLLYVYAQRVNLGVVRRNENAWWSLAPHDVSVANYLLNSCPTSVNASGGVFLQREAGIEDVVFATLHYPKARLAHVHVSWLDPHKTRRLTVVGSRKMAIFDDTYADQKLRIHDKGVEPPPSLSYAEGVMLRTGDIRVPALRMVEPLRRECEAFIESVRTRKPPLADGRAGLEVVRVLEAGARSLSRHGERVTLGTSSIGNQ